MLYRETFPLSRTEAVEGKVFVRLEQRQEDGGQRGRVFIGCSLEGKWALHWGVTYCDDVTSEWDQPPPEMRPPGSVPIKDYAIETPLKTSSDSEGKFLQELQIDLNSSTLIAAIHFVLKEEETGAWYQYRGRDFRIPLVDYVKVDGTSAGGQKGFNIWPGALSQISSLLIKPEESPSNAQENDDESEDNKLEVRLIEGYFEEYPISKEVPVQNSITVTVKKIKDADKNEIEFDTDVPGKVVIHWGVCRGSSRSWQIPSPPYPPKSKIFRKKALQTLLQNKTDKNGSSGLFSLDKDISGVLFVLKLKEYAWLNDKGSDFFVPLISESISHRDKSEIEQAEKITETGPLDGGDSVSRPVESVMAVTDVEDSQEKLSEIIQDDSETTEPKEAVSDGIISEIRNLVTDISSEKSKSTKSKEEQENILQEIEKLAAEAYSIFRSSSPIFVEEVISDVEPEKPPVRISGTGTGYEILLQGFNWESNKSGKWYLDLTAKASELSKMGFTTIWLPPPTESVSAEGYMPKDLYNLNSRYGTMEQLKDLVRSLHEVGIKVLGDVVLNHRCAHYQNQNGIWNIFGGRLNWDDRAIVADDPHFQGRGNKSSGDHFHAAPNIDHSQDFVRRDIKEWLCWLRDEIGYDGWRLDFVRGFWGGYVKDYLEASEPFFSVGEYWDSLSYAYGQMDYNQDSHRQRIVDWINATNGASGAFDVTTKGILHTALEKCEYWRLSDEKGKPPGVMGWWPSRAVTFIENHDTGSTQGHWRFPAGKEMQGYAYILTHPGTPTVFYDHLYSHYQQEIAKLISIRQRLNIHCRSLIKITKTDREVYAAEVDEKLAVKIGPGYYEPSGNHRWVVAAEGRDYKVWESQ